MTDWTSSVGSLKIVLAEMETYVETVDNTKTIRAIGVVSIGGGSAQGYVLHDA